MPEALLYSSSGKRIGKVVLPEEVFGVEPNVHVVHEVVTAQLAAARAGTHSVKRRHEVRGGGAKPWRQKGTGRARVGSIRSPLWVGGARAHGPKPRDYTKRIPKKVKRLALVSALSDRASGEAIWVLESWPDLERPKTKKAVELFEAMGVESDKKLLFVLDRGQETAFLSVRNLPKVHPLYRDQLNTYDVVNSDLVLFTLDALKGFCEKVEVVRTSAPAEGDASEPAGAADDEDSDEREAAPGDSGAEEGGDG